jgi:hypothetical protein
MNHPMAVITTFPSNSWDVYAKLMLSSFVRNWPKEIPLLIKLDDDSILEQIKPLLRETDAVAVGWEKEHREFVERNKDKESPDNYRHMPVRFCHKVFAIKYALDTCQRMKAAGETSPRYLIWLDADVVTNRPITFSELNECLPKEGDAVSYMGRKDWPHSECGWLAFDLEKPEIINEFVNAYITDKVMTMEQQHDSWVFDQLVGSKTNLTSNARGMDVWPQSPMGKWSTHYKGPVAKQQLMQPMREKKSGNMSNVVIQTRNALPHEQLREHIVKNQELIKNWLRPCHEHDEEIVIVSAGPMMIPEEVRREKGKKIIAVKHALQPLKDAGIKPWACILLDPRPHVLDFVQEPDKDILWFVASQVDPKITQTLLDAGCTVWGYHAAVGADEGELTKKQAYAIISGGTATATRGLFVLNHLGFRRFRLYGYDLCVYDKPNLSEKDEQGQPKYFEISIGFNDKTVNNKRCFWTKPELIAQFEELNELIKAEKFEIEAYGDGVIPFIIKSKKIADLRNREFIAKMVGKQISYERLLGCQTWLTNWRRWSRKTRRKRMLDKQFSLN